MEKKILATNEFYTELWACIEELEFITDGLVNIYYLPSVDGRLSLVNSKTKPLGYEYLAIHNMQTGEIKFYKKIEDENQKNK